MHCKKVFTLFYRFRDSNVRHCFNVINTILSITCYSIGQNVLCDAILYLLISSIIYMKRGLVQKISERTMKIWNRLFLGVYFFIIFLIIISTAYEFVIFLYVIFQIVSRLCNCTVQICRYIIYGNVENDFTQFHDSSPRYV